MRLRRFVAIAASVFAMGFVPIGASANRLNGAAISSLSRSILRVTCGNLHGAAFVWQDSRHVLTALHVVNACPRIALKYEVGGEPATARIERALRKYDLALLAISDPKPSPVLQPAKNAPNVNDDLEVLGYPYNVPTLEPTHALLRFGGKLLRDILTQDVVSSLRAAQSPSPDIEIWSLDTPLAPGDSGAPIVDDQSRVIGVGDGGLERGPGESTWAIKIESAALLNTSTDSPGPPTQIKNLYAADVITGSGTTLRCGDVDFTALRERPLASLIATSDDPTGFYQLGFLAFANIDKSGFEYEVYNDRLSGAAVALPLHLELKSSDGICTGGLEGGAIEITVWAKKWANEAEAQQQSVQFEHIMTHGRPSVLDNSFTYPMLITRPDGLRVRRKSGYIANPQTLTYDDYGFETLAVQRGVFLGVAVRRHDPGMRLGQQAQLCVQAPDAPGCPAIKAFFTDWARAVLGVHLTTFSTI